MLTNLTYPKLEKSTIALIIKLAYQEQTIVPEPEPDIDFIMKDPVAYSKAMKWITTKSRKLEMEAISIYETLAQLTIARGSYRATTQVSPGDRYFHMARATLRKHEAILQERGIIAIEKRSKGKRWYTILEPQKLIAKG